MAILGTTALRKEWAPACTGPWAKVSLYGSGVISVRPAIYNAVAALNNCLVAHNYKTRKADTGAYNCRKITGGSGYSLHAYGIAIDINWQTNPYGPRLVTDMPSAMRTAIKAIRTNSGHQVWGWGGDYRTNKDAMHFEIVCTRAQLATGINLSTVPGSKPKPKPVYKTFVMGATDEAIAAVGGEPVQVTELQTYLMLFAEKWKQPSLNPGGTDGDYFKKSADATIAFKKNMVALQKIAKQPVWTDLTSRVDLKVIEVARYWAKALQK